MRPFQEDLRRWTPSRIVEKANGCITLTLSVVYFIAKEKNEMTDENNSLADLFNRVFQLEIDWTSGAHAGSVKTDDLEEFVQLCTQIAALLHDRTLQRAI